MLDYVTKSATHLQFSKMAFTVMNTMVLVLTDTISRHADFMT